MSLFNHLRYFFVDRNQCWYHKGIEGITKNIDETVEYLNKISYEKTHDLILMILGNNWKYDVDNILIFLRNLNWIKYKNINYKKNLITINKKYILEFNEKRIQAILYDKFVDRLGYMNYSYMKWSNILNNNN